jgi:uncharacterized protein (TIGR03083 family)
MTESYQPKGDPQVLKAYYLDQFRHNRAAILDAAARGFDRPIKGCPGWDVAGLTGHMGRVYTFWLKWVRERPRGFSRDAMNEIAADRDARLPGYTAWDQAGFPPASRPDGIVPFARKAGDELDAALADLAPEETVWTFVPAHQTGAFVFRRLAMETTIHRWDAEEAQGIGRPIGDALARDGIDEMLMQFREDPAYEENKNRRLVRRGSGRHHRLRCRLRSVALHHGPPLARGDAHRGRLRPGRIMGRPRRTVLISVGLRPQPER